MLLNRGGTSATARRIFIGESRAGVKILGRVTLADGVDHVQISNLTYDISTVADTGSYNTMSLGTGTDARIDHVTFTGDCKHGANGGHIETNGTTDLVVEACLIEKFGRCGPSGHQDHGVYLASGSNLVLRNNEIRGNASRGIQLNTEQGTYGTLDAVTIENNRIHDNGHADYEDGIVLNGGGTGTITNVMIQHNLIYGNYYSGIRQVDVAYTAVAIQKNTFYANGEASTGALRSEMNLDSSGSGANTTVTKNILQPGYAALDNCYDAASRNFKLVDNVVQGTVPSGAPGNCISQSLEQAPMFVDATAADFHTINSAVMNYGAYAP